MRMLGGRLPRLHIPLSAKTRDGRYSEPRLSVDPSCKCLELLLRRSSFQNDHRVGAPMWGWACNDACTEDGPASFAGCCNDCIQRLRHLVAPGDVNGRSGRKVLGIIRAQRTGWRSPRLGLSDLPMSREIGEDVAPRHTRFESLQDLDEVLQTTAGEHEAATGHSVRPEAEALKLGLDLFLDFRS